MLVKDDKSEICTDLGYIAQCSCIIFYPVSNNIVTLI